MKICKARGIALNTYGEAKIWDEIGKFYCSGHEIPDYTTVLYVNYEEQVEETGSLAIDHEIASLWFCKAYIFCHCGRTHPVLSDVPVESQLRDIIVTVYHRSGAAFKIPSTGPDGYKIVPVLLIEKVPKKIDDLNTWY